jgi:hypothetical protein
MNLVDEFSCDPFEFFDTERSRIDGDAPLRAAVRQIDDGCLPGHQRRQRADFIQVDVVMIAQATLHRPAGVVVLHAVADERLQPAVVHLDGNLHLHFPLGRQQQLAERLRQLQPIGRPFKIEPRRFKGFHYGLSRVLEREVSRC